MRHLKVDKRSLIHSFEYKEKQERDRWDNEYKEPVLIENVRIDLTKIYTSTANGRKVVANGVIFCYASATTPLLKFKEESLIVFDGNEHKIEKVIVLDEPRNKKLWGYELEFI